MQRRVAGAVLAAGSGTRMGRPKAELVIAGERLVDRAVRVLREAGCDPVIAVVRTGTVVEHAVVVVNDDPDRGQRSSLELAVDAVPAHAPLAVILVDTPGLGADAVRTVVEAWRAGHIAVGCYGGRRRGHPTVMDTAAWRDAIALAAPDEGAKALLAARPDLVDDVDVVGDPTDLDTVEDVRRWTSDEIS